MTRNGEESPQGESSTANDSSATDESRDLDAGVSAGRFKDLPARLREQLASRRKFLSDSAKVGGGALALSSAGGGIAAANNDDDDGDQVDQPEGFSAEVVVPHATFTDDVAAAFGVSFEDGREESTFIRDPSTVVIARVCWEPEGTTGWHTHPGAVIVSVLEGEIEFVFREADECVSNTYTAGEAFVDTGGHAEFAANTSDTEQAVAYAIFFSVPDGEPPTTRVEPKDC